MIIKPLTRKDWKKIVKMNVNLTKDEFNTYLDSKASYVCKEEENGDIVGLMPTIRFTSKNTTTFFMKEIIYPKDTPVSHDLQKTIATRLYEAMLDKINWLATIYKYKSCQTVSRLPNKNWYIDFFSNQGFAGELDQKTGTWLIKQKFSGKIDPETKKWVITRENGEELDPQTGNWLRKKGPQITILPNNNTDFFIKFIKFIGNLLILPIKIISLIRSIIKNFSHPPSPDDKLSSFYIIPKDNTNESSNYQKDSFDNSNIIHINVKTFDIGANCQPPTDNENQSIKYDKLFSTKSNIQKVDLNAFLDNLLRVLKDPRLIEDKEDLENFINSYKLPKEFFLDFCHGTLECNKIQLSGFNKPNESESKQLMEYLWLSREDYINEKDLNLPENSKVVNKFLEKWNLSNTSETITCLFETVCKIIQPKEIPSLDQAPTQNFK